MSHLPGNRIRRSELDDAPKPVRTVPTKNTDIFKAILKASFEAAYAPLDSERAASLTSNDDNSDDNSDGDITEKDSEDESDWSGISDTEATPPPVVEVISQKSSIIENLTMTRAERKAFMTSKPPPSSLSSSQPTTNPSKSSENSEDSPTNLANDLELQSLLRTSHLLSPWGFPTSTTPLGFARHKASDLHLTSTLGAKKSLFQQEKMPSSIRKGIVAKKARKEKERREDAKREGVILERFGGKVDKSRKGGKGGGKGRGNVGDASVGKWSGGTLKLSGKDVKSIVGSSSRGGRGGMKGRRGGKRR